MHLSTYPLQHALTPTQAAARSILQSGCSPAALEAALPEAFQDYRHAVASDDAVLIEKAAKKRQSELISLAASFDAVIYSDLAPTLAQFRRLAPLWHQIVDGASGAELGKHAFKALFRSEAPLLLVPADAELFFAFVVDLLVASEAGSLTGNLTLEPATLDAVRALGPFLDATAGAMNTHDAKSAHSSAKLQVVCTSPNEPSQFLNSRAFATVLSARSGGGPLKPVSWLENLYAFQVTLAGNTFTVLDALCSAQLREHLAVHGVRAWQDLPVATTKGAGYNGHLVGQTRIKTAAGSVALNLIPSNAMLSVTASLAARIAEKTAREIAHLYRESVLAAVPESVRTSLGDEFQVEAFVPAAMSRFDEEKLIKALNKFLKPHKVRALDRAVLAEAWKSPAPNKLRQGWSLVRVSVVGSNPNNCGGAYIAYAGNRGPFRFPAAPVIRTRTSSREVRGFHMADSMLGNSLSTELKARQDSTTLEDKYQIGDKWLPRRVQRNMQRGHIQEAAWAYIHILRRLARVVRPTDDERLLLDAPGISALQAYLLHGAKTDPDQLHKLAHQGVAILKSADEGSHAIFVETVVAALQKEYK